MDNADPIDRLIDALISAMGRVDMLSPEAGSFVDRLIGAMTSDALRRNSNIPEGLPLSQEMHDIFDRISAGNDDAVIGSILALWPEISWFKGSRFYPDPKHAYFSEKLWGAELVGEGDAQYLSDGRFIALLMVLAPNSTYPLHAHRIEELYYIPSSMSAWSRDGKNWMSLPSDSVFFNQSYEPHAIRSGDEPMVAICLYLPPYGWEGGLVED